MMMIVAEMSANHLGDVRRAHDIVEAAAQAGADAIKVQVWSPDTMVVDPYLQAPKPWADYTLAELYRQAWTPWEWLPGLFHHAREAGMEPFGAAFDAPSVDYLESLGVKRHKIASFEITDIPLIRYMASKKKPLIISAGAGSDKDVRNAVAAATLEGCGDITVLQCVSSYPAKPQHSNLQRMHTFKTELGCEFGLSDHSRGIGVAVAAAALGAEMIEKHLILSRDDGGLDAEFSMEPDEFRQMALECARARLATGDPGVPDPRTELCRSLWVTRDTPAGHPLVFGDNVKTARPNLGLPCSTNLSMRVASRFIRAGEPLTEDCLGV